MANQTRIAMVEANLGHVGKQVAHVEKQLSDAVGTNQAVHVMQVELPYIKKELQEAVATIKAQQVEMRELERAYRAHVKELERAHQAQVKELERARSSPDEWRYVAATQCWPSRDY